jgi:hypothetical protein
MGHWLSAARRERTLICGKGTSNIENDARNLSGWVGAARYEATDASPEIAYASRLSLITAHSRLG